MTARERMVEYATLKALGFGPGWVAGLIFGESIALALIGGAIGIALTFPVAHEFAKAMGTLFPVFNVDTGTVAMQMAAVLIVGAVAAAMPTLRAVRVRIADGLRNIG
jgi:putative ABC transport system permease protein